jgi:hypothetical protein
MLPAASKANSYSNNTVLKSVGERHLALKNEINFDREKGVIFMNPRLYIQENDHQAASSLLGKITQKFNGLISRYHEWRAKEWFVGFVEKNFEKSEKTRNLLDSVKSSGKVSSSNFLEALVDGGCEISSPKFKVKADGSLRSRYLIENKDQIIDKLIATDLKNKGFSDDAIGAFLNFFHFSDQHWNPGSFKAVMNFLNQYSDRYSAQSPVFLIPALGNKVVKMQEDAAKFDAHQQITTKIKLRKNQGSSADVTGSPKFSRKDLCDHLKISWRFSEIEKNKDDNLNNVLKNPLQDAFLRYLETGTKNMDSVSLENLISYPQLIKLYPYLYAFPDGSKMNNDALRKIFNDVVDELTAMSNQRKSGEIEIEAIETDLLKISMKNIIFNFPKHRDVLGILVFPDMVEYTKSLDKKIINQKNKDAFVAVSQVDLEKVAAFSKLSDEEKLNFSRLIEKLKMDLLEVDSSIKF